MKTVWKKNKVKHVCYLISKQSSLGFSGRVKALSQLLPWSLHSQKTEFTQESMMKDISLEYSSDQGPSVLWHKQWSEWVCHVLKVSGMSLNLCCAQDNFVKIIILKAGSISQILCIWRRFSSRAGSWALRMPWAGTPCAAAQQNQAPDSPQVWGCCRPPFSSPCWLEACGRAWGRVKWASPPGKASPRWGSKSLSCSDTNAWKMNCLWI